MQHYSVWSRFDSIIWPSKWRSRSCVINESPRGDSLCHNDVIMTWTNVDDRAARAMCLVITLTHINYKLLVLYSICYRVYSRSTNNKLYVKWTTLLASSTTHSTLDHQTFTINLTSVFHQPGPNNVRFQIQRAICSVRKPLEKYRTALHVVQSNPQS